MLKQLPTNHIFVGIETGDKQLAKKVGKGPNFSPENCLRAIKTMTKHGIDLTPSFILGLEGETKSTLDKTFEFAQRIKALTRFDEIFAACLIPFPGSRAFTMLTQHYPEYKEQDELDGEELTQRWFAHSCGIDYETAREYTAKILELGEYRITLDKGRHVI